MASSMNIDVRITTALGGIVDLYRDVAETDSTPYAVYTLDYEPSYNKDGIYKYVAEVQLILVAQTASLRDSLTLQCHSAIEEMSGEDLIVIHTSSDSGSDGNIEFVSISSYRITQLINN